LPAALADRLGGGEGGNSGTDYQPRSGQRIVQGTPHSPPPGPPAGRPGATRSYSAEKPAGRRAGRAAEGGGSEVCPRAVPGSAGSSLPSCGQRSPTRRSPRSRTARIRDDDQDVHHRVTQVLTLPPHEPDLTGPPVPLAAVSDHNEAGGGRCPAC